MSSHRIELIVISDTHGLVNELMTIREAHPHADGYLHCGDSERPPSQMKEWKMVLGNNDWYDYPEELVIKFDDFKVYMTHSHRISYFERIKNIAKRAKTFDCQLALFGHSHTFYQEEVEGIMCVNPGSVRYNRDRSPRCYARITIDEKRNIFVERINLESSF